MSIQRLSNSGQSGFRYKSLIAGITPVASVPTIGAATAVTFSTASVAFTAPGAYAATTFTATSSPGGLTGTSASSPITVSGLSEQTAYTFTVTATNATGTSSPSAASSSITTPVAFAPEGAYDALATVTLSATTSSIIFAGIPSGYKHLQVRCISKADAAGNGYSIIASANSDTTVANYRSHYLEGNGSTAVAGTYQSEGGAYFVGGSTGAGTNADWFGATIFDVLDYSATTKNKTFRALTAHDRNGAGNIHFSSAVWLNTNAITSLNISLAGANIVADSHFALYGVK